MSNYTIPFLGVARQYQKIREEILDASDRVYQSGQVLDGSYTKMFEHHMAARTMRQYAVAVNSGTQALIFAQHAIGVHGDAENNAGGKVMIPGISFVATLNSVLMAGNEPVYCDVDHNALLDIETIDYALDGNVSAIMYVNMFGNVLDYNKLLNVSKFFNEDIKIIEDAAQSFGATYNGVPSGKLGDVSVLSFDPTKNLSNYGSGGMILTDDYDVYQSALSLRDNGKISKHDWAGTNSKMSESDCAQMLVKLKYFDAWQQRRAEIAEFYSDNLMNFIDIPVTNTDVDHAWHKYVVHTDTRSGLQGYLASKGIETRIHYDTPLFEHAVGWDYVDYAKDILRGSTAHSKSCLSLPIYPEMTDGEIEFTVESINNYLR
jgi:UDP-2-acetamido-2-deoxy-ribo-hexuluronate aminotransferase